ncbi:MAG: MinD/ParA family protein [Myxococcales bacterium FL481]|nr:MAG: MinD/ParA family protein [Myxococcales bacterium FL481]
MTWREPLPNSLSRPCSANQLMTAKPQRQSAAKPLTRPTSGGTAPAHSGTVVPIGSGKTPMSPTVIAITSGKGGVGKSNIAVGLAIALGRRGARVLCVDADLGLANMDILFGVAPTQTTADLVSGDADIDDVIVEAADNVWLLPGASGQADLADLSDQKRRAFFTAIDSVDDRFDVVVVDTGAGVGSNSVGFAAAAKDIVVVVTGEPTSVADAYGMIKVLCTRCGVRRLHVLVNMVNNHHEGEAVFRRLDNLTSRFLDVRLEFLGVLPRDQGVARAVMRGEPFLRSHPDAPASKALLRIADGLADSSDPDDRQGAIRLFWRKLLRQGGAQ